MPENVFGKKKVCDYLQPIWKHFCSKQKNVSGKNVSEFRNKNSRNKKMFLTFLFRKRRKLFLDLTQHEKNKGATRPVANRHV